MNPDSPKPLREELESRLTALLLGELPAAEAALLREIIAHDPELAKLFARLHQTIGLVRETAATPTEPAIAPTAPLELSEERRQQLLAQFKTVNPKEFAVERRRTGIRLLELAAVLVILGLLALVTMPNFVRSRLTSPANAILNNVRQLDGAKQRWAIENNKSPNDVPTFDDLKPYFKGGEMPGVGGETYVLGKVGEPASAEIDASDAKKPFGRLPAGGDRATRVRLSSSGDLAYVNQLPAKEDRLTTEAIHGPEPEFRPTSDYQVATTPPPAPIVLPAMQQVQTASGNDGDVIEFGVNAAQGRTRGLGESAVDSATGLPLATPESGLVRHQIQNLGESSRFFTGLNLNDAVTAPPTRAGLAGSEQLPLETRIVSAAPSALNGKLENTEGVVLYDKYAETQTGLAVPRVSVTGGMGGGGKTDRADVIASTNFVAADDGAARDKAFTLGENLNLTEGKSQFGKDRKDTLALDDLTADTPKPDVVVPSLNDRFGGAIDNAVPTLGDLPLLGKLYEKPREQVPSNNAVVSVGGRIVPEPGVSSLAFLGETRVKTKPADSAGSPSVDSAAVETPKVQTYFAKKRELEELEDMRRMLTRRLSVAEVDLDLPKSAQVVIVESAQANSAPSQTVWGTIRSAVSGEVERAARIKVERDKSDIEELGGKVGINQYDPYYVQTEFEAIQSEAVLGKAAEELGRGQGTGGNLNKAEAIALLRKQLELRAVPNTSLVEIRAKADKPTEAAKIANTVAGAYKQWRLDKEIELSAGGLKALEQKSREQEEKIRKAKAELAQMRQDLAISDSDASSPPSNVMNDVKVDLPIRKPATNAPIPQPEIQTSENSFSTFSLNVSDVSFKLTAASLEQGQMPDPASIRSEEFINAFDYRDPEPATGAPIAFAWERARYPFAHNRDLLRFSLKTAAAGRQAGRPLNIVLLLDNSGSMERADRVRIIREALRVLATQLQPQDKLSVITFARTPRLWVDGAPGSDAGAVAMAATEITPEGGTNLEDAMNLAYETAARHYLANGINRVVLLTDGAANLGDVEPASLKQKVEAARRQGIALDCFGIGWEGLNDHLLEVLSRNGDGRYGFINSPEEAATDFAGQLAGALKVAASDVKVQVEFNPKRVTAYRQIGYAKHQLTKEQFRDNTVDAAEIAAQEAGNALYTVEVNPAGNGPLCTVRVRYKVPGTTDYREQAWDVPYTGNALSLDQASPAMRLAASASAFAEWLVASPFAGEVTPDALLGYLRGVPEVFGADSRPTKLEWMIRQAKSLEGK